MWKPGKVARRGAQSHSAQSHSAQSHSAQSHSAQSSGCSGPSALSRDVDSAHATPAASAIAKGEITAFLATIGAQVRQLRQQKAISRRALSERSGISQRYLAQLEAGSGNISLALLYRLAAALGRDPTFFLEPDPSREAFVRLFANANPAQRRRALECLRTPFSPEGKARRLGLIGLRGAGKSTLGAWLAKALAMPFVELNRVVAEEAGMSVSDVMALYGQEGFRQLEHDALIRVVREQQEVVLATGGGIVSEPGTYERLLGCFYTIWLKAAPEEHMKRVRNQGDERPMAGNPAAMNELRAILASRDAFYARADAALSTSGQSPQTSLRELKTLATALLPPP